MPRFGRLELDDQRPEEPGGGDLTPPEEARDEHYWLRLADRERRQGHHENALRMYSRALEYNKSVIPAWVGQVQMLVMLGEYPEAELWARKALEIFKNNPDLLAGRAQAFCRMGDRRRAMACCDQALQQPGDSAYRWMARGELMVAGKESLDRHCFDKAVLADPDWLVPLEIALILLHYDQPSKALPRLRAAIEGEPESFFAWWQRANCEKALGLTEAARRSVRRCLELAPGHPEARHLQDTLDRPGGILGRILNLFGR